MGPVEVYTESQWRPFEIYIYIYIYIKQSFCLALGPITLPTKVRLVKAMVFPVVMYGCESWTINKAERQRIDAFELWCWRSVDALDCKKIQPVHPEGDRS